MKIQKKTIKLKDLVFDNNFYPRATRDWMKVYDYMTSIEAGVKMPPITVILRKDKYLVIDGWHRSEAVRKLKHKSIKTEVLKGLSDKQIFIEAVKRNITHGQPFSPYDKRNIVIKLQEFKFNPIEISNIVHIPATKLTRFISSNLVSSMTGESIVTKSPLDNLTEQDSVKNIGDQKYIQAMSQLSLLNQVLVLLRNKWINKSNKQVKVRLKQIKKLL